MNADDVGPLFEAQFNAGMLHYIARHPQELSFPHAACYEGDLAHLDIRAILARFLDRQQLIDPAQREIARRAAVLMLWKGFVSGYTFLADYLHAIRQRGCAAPVEVRYYQCSFRGANSFNLLPQDESGERRTWLGQIGIALDSTVTRYTDAGEFLKADTLLWLVRGDAHRILALDTSAFAARFIEHVRDLGRVEDLYAALLTDVNHIGAKSHFAQLHIDASVDSGLAFSTGLGAYFTAFMHKDKEAAKLIQAASYARSFYRFLSDRQKISPHDDLRVNAVGYTDRGANTLSLRSDRFAVLDACASIYKRYRSESRDRTTEIAAARERVVQAVQANAALSFKEGTAFVQKLQYLASTPGTHMIEHVERLDRADFTNSVGSVDAVVLEACGLGELPAHETTLRDAHAVLLMRALAPDTPWRYIFATGNPGIGKTTAVATYLKAHSDEGYLLFYASPRTTVNLDIMTKFRRGDGFYHPDFLGLTTNADVIRENGNVPTVRYLASHPERTGAFQCHGVAFLDEAAVQVNARQARWKGHRHLVRATNEKLRGSTKKPTGVLASLCSAIPAAIESGLSRTIAAAVSVQSLKRTGPGTDTLEHVRKLFASAYNERTRTVFPDRMRDLSTRIKNIIIMIDEITGDEAGVEFLRRIDALLRDYALDQHGFNVKVVIADASLVDPAVVRTHLSFANTAPEPDKIFFKKLTKADINGLSPLTQTEFSFHAPDGATDAILINANSYPATNLTLGYKVNLQRLRLDDGMTPQEQREALRAVYRQRDDMHAAIVADIGTRLSRPSSEAGQLIVYIQDKERLGTIIDAVATERQRTGRTFAKNTDYLEIHANISDEDKASIDRLKDGVAAIFMTSSASRGLSFPKARHFLVEVPHFQVENNLMEIIQVIYRGRGDAVIDRMDKDVAFYISDVVVTRRGEDEELRARESMLDTLTMLTLLKAAVMTRITGAGVMRGESVSIIPIGGKSVSAAGSAYHAHIADFARKLRRESYRYQGDADFRAVHAAMERIWSHSEITVRTPPAVSSYLSLCREWTADDLLAALDRGGRGLLDRPPLQAAHVAGGVLIVPVTDSPTETTHHFPLRQVIAPYANRDLVVRLKRMIANTHDYPRDLSRGAKLFLELLDEIADADRSQHLSHASSGLRAYYALPLSAFVAGDTYRHFFEAVRKGDRADKLPFRTLLHAYLLALSYPVETALPIGGDYRRFPYLFFTSYDLGSMRRRMFSDGYILMSNEMNILNLILSDSSTPSASSGVARSVR